MAKSKREQEKDMIDEETLILMKKHARSASFHYADDSCKEWGLADRDKASALAIFDAHPEDEEKLREALDGELWSIGRERPRA